MQTQCNKKKHEFQNLGNRRVQAVFDGEHLSSEGGVLLLREIDERLGLTQSFAACFTDYRDPDLIEHSLEALLRQRIYGIAQGYEDLNDHKDLQRDPLLALAVGNHDVEGENRHRQSDKGKALASPSTLNRIELTAQTADETQRYKKIVYHAEKIESLFVDTFLDSYAQAPEEIVLDFDATDDPIHGEQEGRFYHGYYKNYCYLPLYVTCGKHLLVSKLREADKDASAGSVEVLEKLVEGIRARWPEVRIIFRADSGFARDSIMAWCEKNAVFYLIGLAKNDRLRAKIRREMDFAHIRYLQTGVATRRFASFYYRTLKSWTRTRRVVGKAEHLRGGPNPRFVVTNLPEDYASAQALYEEHYCARGEMENRIKEQQMDLFADRTSSHIMRANQLRVFFSSMAYVLISALRRIALKGTAMAQATCGSIRLKLFKIAAQVKVSVRRFVIHLSAVCPYQQIFTQALGNINAYPLRN